MVNRQSSARLLFEIVGLEPLGPVAWREAVPLGQPGVYAVEMRKPRRRAPLDLAVLDTWLRTVPTLRIDGRAPTAALLARRLRHFWVPEETILYAGVATKSIRSRVRGYYATPLGASRPHAGGDWLKTLLGLDSLLVWWASTPTSARAVKAEAALQRAFDSRVSDVVRQKIPGGKDWVLPFANKRREPDGWIKPHGIKGARL